LFSQHGTGVNCWGCSFSLSGFLLHSKTWSV
jgi:hypothetical protein